LQRYSSYSPSLQAAQTQLRLKALKAEMSGAAAFMVEVATASLAVASMDEASTDKAPVNTGTRAATGTAMTTDMATGTESLPGTMSALSSGSV